MIQIIAMVELFVIKITTFKGYKNSLLFMKDL